MQREAEVESSKKVSDGHLNNSGGCDGVQRNEAAVVEALKTGEIPFGMPMDEYLAEVNRLKKQGSVSPQAQEWAFPSLEAEDA